MITVAAGLGGLVAAVALWRALGPMFASPVLERENYRGRKLPVATGLVVMIAVLLVAGVAWLLGVLFDDAPEPALRSVSAAAALTLGLGWLGFIDDVLGTTTRRGFRGHLGALGRGEVTTGLVKLAGSPAVALVALATLGPIDAGSLRSALVIAAAANLGNLFDRAPGRVIKVAVLATLGLAPAAGALALAGPLAVIGAACGLAPVDLAERGMLGDTGANALGGSVGLVVVTGFGATGQWVALAVLVALNLTSEFVSFSRVIATTPPLRWLDGLGRH